MKVIVDTSVVIAVIVNEPHKLQLIEATKGAELIAPASLHWEIGNAFSAMFKRKRITLETAQAAIAEYKKIPIQFVEVKLETTLELAKQLNIYAYDAYFLSCAKRFNAPLLSLDKSLLEKAENIGIKLKEVTL